MPWAPASTTDSAMSMTSSDRLASTPQRTGTRPFAVSTASSVSYKFCPRFWQSIFFPMVKASKPPWPEVLRG